MPQEFGESNSALSHTHEPKSVLAGEFRINDFPGLLDSGGVEQDEKNIRQIVEYIRPQGSTKAFILIINEQAPRFDSGMQDAIKLLYDSFGPLMLGNCGFVFTRSYGTYSHEEVQRHVQEILALFGLRGMHASHVPFWQVNNHPDQLRLMAALAPLDVNGAIIAQYDDQKRINEANNAIQLLNDQIATAHQEGDLARAQLLEMNKALQEQQLEINNNRMRIAEAEKNARNKEDEQNARNNANIERINQLENEARAPRKKKKKKCIIS
eukprot:gene23649-30667_t